MCKTMSYDSSVRIEWTPEDVAYIGTRSQRYPDALDIKVGWAQEVVAIRSSSWSPRIRGREPALLRASGSPPARRGSWW